MAMHADRGEQTLYQPRKRVFIAVLTVACLLILAAAFLLWYVPNVGLA